MTELSFRVGVLTAGDPSDEQHAVVEWLDAQDGVASVAVAVGTWWLTPLGAVVQVVGLAAFPTAYRSVHGEPLGDSALRA